MEQQMINDEMLDDEMVAIKELMINHSYEIMALVGVLEKKGILTRGEVIEEIKRIRGE
jgi:hypothetical protein